MYDTLSHPLVSPGDKLFSDSYRNSLHYSYSHSQHEGKWVGRFSVDRAKIWIFQMSPILYAASQITFIPFTDMGINVKGSPESPAFMQKKAGRFVRGDSQWVSFLNLWSLGVVHDHLQLGWQGAQRTLTLVCSVI